MCSPQSIIFTAVTDGRKADCNYSYRYWGHLEVVSPHWKTELLLSHKGQAFITCSSARIHRRIPTSNWMHRHKEANKRTYLYLRRRQRRKKITIIHLWDWVHVPSTTVLFLPSLFDVPFHSERGFCLTEEVITKAMKGGIHRRSSDWCLSQARWWMYTRKHTRMHYAHYARRGVCLAARLREENLPWHHPGECRCRAVTGSESQEAWWGRLCHATDRLWESGVRECDLHLLAELAGALRLWTCSLYKHASLISLCNQVDEACF